MYQILITTCQRIEACFSSQITGSCQVILTLNKDVLFDLMKRFGWVLQWKLHFQIEIQIYTQHCGLSPCHIVLISIPVFCKPVLWESRILLAILFYRWGDRYLTRKGLSEVVPLTIVSLCWEYMTLNATKCLGHVTSLNPHSGSCNIASPFCRRDLETLKFWPKHAHLVKDTIRPTRTSRVSNQYIYIWCLQTLAFYVPGLD